MITTIEVKAHLRDVLELGGGTTNVLVLGSCRTVPYLNYLTRCNRMVAENYRIFAIEPNNWHWNENGAEVDIEEELKKLENDDRILSVIQSADIFIHEHYANFRMFNTNKDSFPNIYEFGMMPDVDIAIPNFHNHFILENDFKDFGELPEDYISRGEAEIEKFCGVCELSSFPEFAHHFRNTWRETRYFWRPNHVSAEFTRYIFELMNEKFLKLNLPDNYWTHDALDDLFREPHTSVTQRDRDGYRLLW